MAKQKKAAAKKAKKSGGKKKANGNGNGHALAERLTDLTKQAGKVEGVNEVAPYLKKLDTGSMTHKDLVALRDAIKVTAAALREAEQGGLASEFSTANRMVRRLERAARKAKKAKKE